MKLRKLFKTVPLMLALVMAFSIVMPVAAAERRFINMNDADESMITFISAEERNLVATDGNEITARRFINMNDVDESMITFISAEERNLVVTDGNEMITVLPNGHQIVRMPEMYSQVRSTTFAPTIEVSIYSPIANLMGFDIDADAASLADVLGTITSLYGMQIEAARTKGATFVLDESVIIAHQAQIDEMLELVSAYGIESVNELSAVLEQTIDSTRDCIGITPFWCPGGVCHAVPVWVLLNGIWFPGYQCIRCGRVFIFW